MEPDFPAMFFAIGIGLTVLVVTLIPVGAAALIGYVWRRRRRARIDRLRDTGGYR